MEIRRKDEYVITDWVGNDPLYGSGKTKNEAFTKICDEYYEKRRELENKLQQYKDYEEQLEMYRRGDDEYGLPFQEALR